MGGLAYSDQRRLTTMPSDQDRNRDRRPPRPDNRGQPPPRQDNRGQPPPERSRYQQEVADVLSGDAGKIDAIAERLGRSLADRKLTPSQLRNFYGPLVRVRAMQTGDEPRIAALRMHRSRLAYLVKRADGKADELWDVFGELLKSADGQQVDSVCNFAEAVVAYHRFFKGDREEVR
jgi:CRISPR type III-A-associated protein Csm2